MDAVIMKIKLNEMNRGNLIESQINVRLGNISSKGRVIIAVARWCLEIVYDSEKLTNIGSSDSACNIRMNI